MHFSEYRDNYRRYRNFEITAGTELIQTNVSIKASVATDKEWNKNLNATLNALFKQVKDLKTKFGDLKDAACKLDNSYKDKCNIRPEKGPDRKVSRELSGTSAPPLMHVKILQQTLKI